MSKVSFSYDSIPLNTNMTSDFLLHSPSPLQSPLAPSIFTKFEIKLFWRHWFRFHMIRYRWARIRLQIFCYSHLYQKFWPLRSPEPALNGWNLAPRSKTVLEYLGTYMLHRIAMFINLCYTEIICVCTQISSIACAKNVQVCACVYRRNYASHVNYE